MLLTFYTPIPEIQPRQSLLLQKSVLLLFLRERILNQGAQRNDLKSHQCPKFCASNFGTIILEHEFALRANNTTEPVAIISKPRSKVLQAKNIKSL